MSLVNHIIAHGKLGFPTKDGLVNTATCHSTPPVVVSYTSGNPVITLAAIVTGGRDPIWDIEPGMNCVNDSGTSVGTVLSVDTAARKVTLTAGALGVATIVYFGTLWSIAVPPGVTKMYASYCGGALGGAGGFAGAGGGGGGGSGAASSFTDVLLNVTPLEVLTIQCGIGGPGGAIGAAPPNNGGSGTVTSVDTVLYNATVSSVATPTLLNGQPVPIAKPNKGASFKAAAGGATSGGKGGDSPSAYSGTAGFALGGAAGTSSASAGPGSHAVQVSRNRSSGAAGGGGSGTHPSSVPADGGSDTMHTDNLTTVEAGCGGAGGSSAFGKGGQSGHSTLRDPGTGGGLGGDALGYGAGGGGGRTNFAGGNGAPGIVILRW